MGEFPDEAEPTCGAVGAARAAGGGRRAAGGGRREGGIACCVFVDVVVVVASAQGSVWAAKHAPAAAWAMGLAASACHEVTRCGDQGPRDKPQGRR